MKNPLNSSIQRKQLLTDLAGNFTTMQSNLISFSWLHIFVSDLLFDCIACLTRLLNLNFSLKYSNHGRLLYICTDLRAGYKRKLLEKTCSVCVCV